ncbi:hypothetical protein PspLS_09506 [Pyricularia sp. CBS 133598]|nr:hypothetical protein PspLS_09506 [Pyricularia sp. CBS 133598]
MSLALFSNALTITPASSLATLPVATWYMGGLGAGYNLVQIDPTLLGLGGRDPRRPLAAHGLDDPAGDAVKPAGVGLGDGAPAGRQLARCGVALLAVGTRSPRRDAAVCAIRQERGVRVHVDDDVVQRRCLVRQAPARGEVCGRRRTEWVTGEAEECRARRHWEEAVLGVLLVVEMGCWYRWSGEMS